MSESTGDKARFHRLRKAKIARRKQRNDLRLSKGIVQPPASPGAKSPN